MVLTRRQFACARRWLPLWSLLLVLMSSGSQRATDLCTLSPHCSQSERTLEKAMPCGSFTAALAMAVLISTRLTVARLTPDLPCFVSPSLFVPEAPVTRLERPPRQRSLPLGMAVQPWLPVLMQAGDRLTPLYHVRHT